VAARKRPFPRLNLGFGRSCFLTASTHLAPRSAGILWYRLPASPVEVQEVDHCEDGLPTLGQLNLRALTPLTCELLTKLPMDLAHARSNQDADKPVREGAQSLVVGRPTGALPVVERTGAWGVVRRTLEAAAMIAQATAG
jgi:hypothetical protein